MGLHSPAVMMMVMMRRALRLTSLLAGLAIGTGLGRIRAGILLSRILLNQVHQGLQGLAVQAGGCAAGQGVTAGSASAGGAV